MVILKNLGRLREIRKSLAVCWHTRAVKSNLGGSRRPDAAVFPASEKARAIARD
jgi:hypothetical protein